MLVKIFAVITALLPNPPPILSQVLCGGAKAYHSGHRMRGRVHLGQVASVSEHKQWLMFMFILLTSWSSCK